MAKAHNYQHRLTFRALNVRFDRQLRYHWKNLHKTRALAAARRVVNNIPHLLIQKPNYKEHLVSTSFCQAARLALMADDRYLCMHYIHKSLIANTSSSKRFKLLLEALIVAIHFDAKHRMSTYLNDLLDFDVTPTEIIVRVSTYLDSLPNHRKAMLNEIEIIYRLNAFLCKKFPHRSALINNFLRLSSPYEETKETLKIIGTHLADMQKPGRRIIDILSIVSKDIGIPHLNRFNVRDQFIDFITNTYARALVLGQRILPQNIMTHLIACVNNNRNSLYLRQAAAIIILKISCQPRTVSAVKKFFNKKIITLGVAFPGLQLLFDQGIKNLEDPTHRLSKYELRNKLLVLRLVCNQILKISNLTLPKHRQLLLMSRKMLRRGLVQLDSDGPKLDTLGRKKLLDRLKSIVSVISDEVGIKRPKLAFKSIRTGDYAVYDDETNTIIVNHKEILKDKEFKNKDQKILWLVAHELGHAYQKHHIKLSRFKHASLAANFATYFHDDWLPSERRKYFKHIDNLYVQQPIEAHANQFAAKILGHLDIRG